MATCEKLPMWIETRMMLRHMVMMCFDVVQ